MTALTLLALESPEKVGEEVAALLEGGPVAEGAESQETEQWLLLLAAVLCGRPDIAKAGAIRRLEALLRNLEADPDADADTLRMAGEVLKFAISSPVGREAAGAAMRLLAEPRHKREAYQAAIGALRWAACWAIDLLDAESLLNMLLNTAAVPPDIIEPCLFAADTIPSDLPQRLAQLYGDADEAKYCVYYVCGKIQDQFALHAQVANRLGQGRRRILVVHNINDRQGDEIIRIVPLAQALLDFNRELEVVLITRRIYLYAHPRITTVPVSDKERVGEVLREQFDGLVDFFEPEVKQVNFDLAMEARVEELRRVSRPFLDLGSRKGLNHFLYERVECGSQALAGSLGLDRRRVENIYEPTMRVIAELGLPLRRGQEMPRSETVLAGVAWPEAEAFWRRLTGPNHAGRPVAMLLPFGGAEPLKGYVSAEGIAAEMRSLIREGFYVVAMPNGESWGSTSFVEQAAALLAAEERGFAVVGPAADASAGANLAEVAGGGSLPFGDIPSADMPFADMPFADMPFADMPFADVVMRLVIYGIRLVDLVVTVEGWMMHAAYCLGKAYRVLMLPYSHPDEWHPYGRTRWQGVFPAAGDPRSLGAGPPLLEQPRKFVFLFLLRELGRTECADALPLLRRAITSPDRHIRLAGTEALARFWNSGAEGWLAPLLRDPSHQVRGAAAQAFLSHSTAPEGVAREHLQAHAWIGQTERNWEAVLRLGSAARPALEQAAQGDDPVVQHEAAQALRVLDFKANIAAARRASGHGPAGEGMLARVAGRLRNALQRRNGSRPPGPAKILILTPVKDAAAFIPGYYRRITHVTYPGKRISLGFLESDSIDSTYAELEERLPRLRKKFRRVELWKKDFGFQIPPGGSRWAEHIQAERRSVLAKSRNHLLFHALDDEDWVVWLDVDVIEYPNDILERMLATGKDIVQPHCVVDYEGPTFDRNAWRDHGRLHMDSLREEGELVKLDAVGGTMLLVRADVHREGLIFPASPYGKASASARTCGELETEGLGIMARDMGYQCWGMPRLEIRHGKW